MLKYQQDFTENMNRREHLKNLKRPWRRWEDIIKTDLKYVWCEGVDWIHLA
jgi:hypothetical protein